MFWLKTSKIQDIKSILTRWIGYHKESLNDTNLSNQLSIVDVVLVCTASLKTKTKWFDLAQESNSRNKKSPSDEFQLKRMLEKLLSVSVLEDFFIEKTILNTHHTTKEPQSKCMMEARASPFISVPDYSLSMKRLYLRVFWTCCMNTVVNSLSICLVDG